MGWGVGVGGGVTQYDFDFLSLEVGAVQQRLAEGAGPGQQHHEAAGGAAGGEVHAGQGLGHQPVAKTSDGKFKIIVFDHSRYGNSKILD